MYITYIPMYVTVLYCTTVGRTVYNICSFRVKQRQDLTFTHMKEKKKEKN